MNILFLSTENPFPPDHGHHIRTYYTLKHLALSHQIFFLAFAKTQKELKYQSELEKFCVSVDIILLPLIKWRWQTYASMLANLFSGEAYTITRYASSDARAKIQHILAANYIDLVHFDLPHLAPYLKEVMHLPKILVNHNVESLRILRWARVERNHLVKLYLYYQYAKLYRLESRLCPQFDRCIAVSDIDKKVLIEMCKLDNFTVVPNGVDGDYFQPSNNSRGKSDGLVWVGSMSGAYNRDAVDFFLAKIAPIIHARRADVTMLFVGASPTKLLQERARKNANIKFTGYVDDVRPYVDSGAAFIAPIRSGSGTKVKILNAMAQAKPVVTTSIGAEGIDVTPEKDILIADNETEFAEKTIFLLQNPQEAQEIGRRARRLIEDRYDWRIIAKIMSKVYENVALARLSELGKLPPPLTASNE